MHNASFVCLQYDLAVTVHHDNESDNSASRYDVYLPQRPVVSLDNYINGAMWQGVAGCC